MNRKQRGAATEGDVTGAERGWFERLRSQPGFRTAFVAFCLTVILGVGAPAAYALWSASVTGSVSVKTIQPPLPAITGNLQCVQPFGVGVVSMRYTKPAQLPAGAHVVAAVTIPGKSAPIHYAVQANGNFDLKDLPGLGDYIGPWIWARQITVTVNTAYLTEEPLALPREIQASSISPGATPSTAPASAYFIASYFC